MRKTIALLVILLLFTLLTVVACTRSASGPIQPPKAPGNVPTSTIDLALATMAAMPPIELPPVTRIEVGEARTNQSFVCASTGFTLNTEAVFDCDLEAEIAIFTMPGGEVIYASLYSLPRYPAIADTVEIPIMASLKTHGAQRMLNCALHNVPSHNVVTDKHTTVTAVCHVSSEVKLKMSYTIVAAQHECVPNHVLSLAEPGDFTLTQPARYIVELAFPGVAGENALFVNDLSWTQINPDEIPFAFAGGIGNVYLFQDECEDREIVLWATRNLTSPPTQIEIWDRAGVLK